MDAHSVLSSVADSVVVIADHSQRNHLHHLHHLHHDHSNNASSSSSSNQQMDQQIGTTVETMHVSLGSGNSPSHSPTDDQGNESSELGKRACDNMDNNRSATYDDRRPAPKRPKQPLCAKEMHMVVRLFRYLEEHKEQPFATASDLYKLTGDMLGVARSSVATIMKRWREGDSLEEDNKSGNRSHHPVKIGSEWSPIVNDFVRNQLAQSKLVSAVDIQNFLLAKDLNASTTTVKRFIRDNNVSGVTIGGSRGKDKAAVAAAEAAAAAMESLHPTAEMFMQREKDSI